jgi:hypothetical protein
MEDRVAGGLTLVAYYEGRPDVLTSLIRQIQAAAAALTGTLQARPLDSVHATLIALDGATAAPETDAPDPQPWEPTEHDAANLVKLCLHLQRTLDARQMNIRFGFDDRDHGLRSQGRSLHERGFTVKDDNLLLIGWPVLHGRPTGEIDQIRRGCERFGFRHKHYVHPGCVDPDLYLVLGRVDARAVGSAAIAAFETEIRRGLADHPSVVPLRASDLTIVRYTDRSLARDRSAGLRLTEITPSLEPAQLLKLLGG